MVERQTGIWTDPLRRVLELRRQYSTPAGRSSGHGHSHLHGGGCSHSHGEPTDTGDDNEEEDEEGEGESDAAWETVEFALEGVERALSTLS